MKALLLPLAASVGVAAGGWFATEAASPLNRLDAARAPLDAPFLPPTRPVAVAADPIPAPPPPAAPEAAPRAVLPPVAYSEGAREGDVWEEVRLSDGSTAWRRVRRGPAPAAGRSANPAPFALDPCAPTRSAARAVDPCLPRAAVAADPCAPRAVYAAPSRAYSYSYGSSRPAGQGGFLTALDASDQPYAIGTPTMVAGARLVGAAEGTVAIFPEIGAHVLRCANGAIRCLFGLPDQPPVAFAVPFSGGGYSYGGCR